MIDEKHRPFLMRTLLITSIVFTICAAWQVFGAGAMIVLTGGGCETSEWQGLLGMLNFFVLVACLFYQIFSLGSPTTKRVAWALAVPVFSWALHMVLHKLDDQRQAVCANRTFAEAVKFCKADQRWFEVKTHNFEGNLKPSGYVYDVAYRASSFRAAGSEMCLLRWSRAHKRSGNEEYDFDFNKSDQR